MLGVQLFPYSELEAQQPLAFAYVAAPNGVEQGRMVIDQIFAQPIGVPQARR